ncbi:hypothetical protein L9F63_011704, partial [Diploptera punctata]
MDRLVNTRLVFPSWDEKMDSEQIGKLVYIRLFCWDEKNGQYSVHQISLAKLG